MKNRMIPVVLLRNGWIVQSKNFSKYQNLEIQLQVLRDLVSGRR